MTISSMMTTALSGMQTEQNRMLTAAGNIARAGPGASAPAASPGMTESETSLAHELVAMKQAETGFKANALVLATGADLWDVLMTIKRD
ncbi:flagellar basal body rod protein [Hoeflea sp. YIM 152468]|uniref:flagellar basal body rod protein n=1 Tax=Hoeflea sp. YIM 152468 TaxID=3031759 RepID=UPI0023D9BE1D|nr:flagellar basal body rod protein [Hoeflea sp. YIM 152468]MDF1607543.1 flagellar basal body rod protein [Hoeflea sp. YIM 152468]